jgi:transposase
MMGPTQRRENKLFYTRINLDQRMPAEHPLRLIARAVDFGFVRAQVQHLYGRRGNPSVDPVVLLKLMFLLYYEDIHSERALMRQLPLRLDWMWFCGYDLDDTTPHHSVISKARRRWGEGVFQSLFEQVLVQCIEAGLVDGEVVHVDASIVTANADRSRLRPALRLAGQGLYQTLESAAGPVPQSAAVGQVAAAAPRPASQTHVSPTDPDARLTRTYGQTVLGYKDHRVVDDRTGIITATVTTDAARAEAQMLPELLDQHERHAGRAASTVVADKGYGTAENYKAVHDRDAQPCIPHERYVAPEGKFPHEAFHYEAQRDCYICPAGQELRLSQRDKARQRHRYRAARGVCAACKLKNRCSDSATGRLVGRHLLQRYIDWADSCFSREHRLELLRRRKIRAEGSFADAANNHGYRRARWRRLAKVRIQNLLIATIQNLRKLLKAWACGAAETAVAVLRTANSACGHLIQVFCALFGLHLRPQLA